MLPFDSEYAYKRGIELMDDIESESPGPRSRQLALCGVWKPTRKYVEACMYVRLFDCTLRGVSLDEAILNELEPFANVPVSPVVQPRLIVRQPVAERYNGEVSFSELHTADDAALRNQSFDVDAGDGFPFIL